MQLTLNQQTFLIFFSFNTYKHAQFEQLLKYIQKRKNIYKKSFTQKQSLDQKLLAISKKQKNIEKETKGDVSSKSIELLIILVVISCKGRLIFISSYSNKATLNISLDKMYSIVEFRIWTLSLSFMFSLPKISV